MSDEVLSIDVNDAAVDNAISRLEQALALKEKLTGQPTQNNPYGIIVNESPAKQQAQQQKTTAKPRTSLEAPDTSKLETVQQKADETQQKVNLVVSEGQAKLTELNSEAEAAKTKTTNLSTNQQNPNLESSKQQLDAYIAKAESAKTTTNTLIQSGEQEIKGLESASNRVIRMIPGLREAKRLQHDIGLATTGNIMGVLGLLMLAYSIYQQANRMLEDQKQQQQEYKSLIIQAQNFTSNNQYQAWQTQMTNALSYRSRPIVK